MLSSYHPGDMVWAAISHRVKAQRLMYYEWDCCWGVQLLARRCAVGSTVSLLAVGGRNGVGKIPQ